MAGQGVFISVEGGEGVGKSLFCQSLQSLLAARGLQPLLTREPGGTEQGEEIRRIFLQPFAQPWLKTAELCLISAARAQHVAHVIEPHLHRGGWVICDRFADSTRVYQGFLGLVPLPEIDHLTQLCCQGRDPDLTFILDCPVPVARDRLSQRGQDLSRFDKEQAPFHEQIRQAYLTLAARYPQRCHVLDAAQAPKQVMSAAQQILDGLWMK